MENPLQQIYIIIKNINNIKFMEKIIAFSNKTEARDKFTKALQYSSKILAWSFLRVDKSLNKRFNDLYLMARDSRKIFRLFKSIQEIKTINDKIKDLLWRKEKVPVLLEICSRIGYLIYWIFDNFFILASVKIIKNENMNQYSYIAHMGWFVGIIWALVKNLYELVILLYSGTNSNSNSKSEKEKEKDLKIFNQNNEYIQLSSNSQISQQKDYREINRKKEILNLMICIIGKIGDLIPASTGIYLPERILGYQLNDGIIGLGGLISATLAMWGLWNQF